MGRDSDFWDEDVPPVQSVGEVEVLSDEAPIEELLLARKRKKKRHIGFIEPAERKPVGGKKKPG